jgi:hypothetical protein
LSFKLPLYLLSQVFGFSQRSIQGFQAVTADQLRQYLRITLQNQGFVAGDRFLEAAVQFAEARGGLTGVFSRPAIFALAWFNSVSLPASSPSISFIFSLIPLSSPFIFSFIPLSSPFVGEELEGEGDISGGSGGEPGVLSFSGIRKVGKIAVTSIAVINDLNFFNI